MHNQGGEQTIDTAKPSEPCRFHPEGSYMKAGVNFNSSEFLSCSMMEVIIPAAWKAMFLDGYAASVGYMPSWPLVSAVAGGM